MVYNTTIRPVAGVGSLVCLLWSVVTQGGFLFCVLRTKYGGYLRFLRRMCLPEYLRPSWVYVPSGTDAENIFQPDIGEPLPYCHSSNLNT